MAELVVRTFDVSSLSAQALSVMKAAVLYAEKNRQARTHTMSIDEFCRLAGLPSFCVDSFQSLLREACGALAIVQAIDTSAPDKDDLPYCSWPVFDRVSLMGCDVTFGICNLSFDEGILACLANIEPFRCAIARK
jgi:hypothetical protein